MTKTEPAPATPARNGKGRPVRASAQRIQASMAKDVRGKTGKHEDWQAEAWEYFDDIGLVKQVIYYRGAQMSKFRIFAAVRPADDPEGEPIPVSDPESGVDSGLATRAQEEIARIKGPSGGTSEILRLLDMNNEICGEAWMVGLGPSTRMEKSADGTPVEVLTPESWNVRSILEVRKADGSWKVQNPETLAWQTLQLAEDGGSDVLVRVWQRHPAYAGRADCHMRAVLTDCESLVLLTNEVKAESKSRQNNGLLFIPNDLTVSTPTRTTPANQDADPDAIDDYPEDTESDIATIAEALGESMLDPIEDPGSPYSVEPRIITGPADSGKEIRYIPLNREASKELENRISARKEAIAQGLNVPVEVAQGLMHTTFANAEQVNEDVYNKFLQPSAVLFCDMWTVGLLQPALIDGGVAPELAERIIVWYDPSELLETVDPTENVEKAVTLDLISDEAARRYWNFTEDDAPPAIDRLIRAILKQRTWDPGLVDAVVKAIDPGLKLPAPAPLPTGPVPPQPNQAPNAPKEPMPPQASLLNALLQVREEGPDSPASIAALAGLYEMQAMRASAKPAAPHIGRRFAQGDRELTTKTLAVVNSAMTRALERAGNRLKAKPGVLRETLRTVHPLYAAQQLGPAVLAAQGVDSAELLDDDAFDTATNQFHIWARHWQQTALALAAGFAGLTAAQKQHLAQQQAQHLQDASEWMNGQLNDLAGERLYQPDDTEPARGEFDPTSRVPSGLVRTAVAIAGGATALEFVRESEKYVATSGGKAPGGIGTGDLLTSAIVDSGTAVVEGYQWDYGSAYRLHEYEPHSDLDGEVVESALDFPATDFDDYAWPGDHDGCVPAGTIVEGASPSALTLRWYEGTVVEFTTAGGEQLTVTPNHPILTDRGWIPAQFLVEGDNLVRCIDRDAASAVIPDDYQAPTAVEDLFAARWVSPSVIAAGVPVATEDFHGDGREGQVCVVLTDRDLMPDVHAAFPQPEREEPLGGVRGVAARLAGACSAFEGLIGVGPTTLRSVSGGGHGAVLLGSSAGGGDDLRLMPATWGDTKRDQLASDRSPVHAESLAESQDGLTGAVELDKLIRIERRPFVGHVFNLHTSQEWYTANNIVIHNCLCGPLIPVYAEVPVTEGPTPQEADLFGEGA